jgi:hypothetical protein
MPSIFSDKVTIGDLLIFNDPVEYPVGIVGRGWGCDVLNGWDRTPPVDAPYTDIGMVDGEIAGEFFAAKGRFIDVGGWVHAFDRATADALWDQIVLGFRRNEELVLTRFEPVPKLMRVRRVAPVERFPTGPEAFRWGTTVKAGDPFKYGVSPIILSAGVAGFASGGRTYPRMYPLEYDTTLSGEGEKVTIVNSGTANSKNLVIELTGPLVKGAWRLVNETSEELLKFDVGLLAGDSLVINFMTETALLNGAVVSASIIGDFWDLEPGTNVIKLYADYDPAAGFTATAYPAWE